MNFYPSWIHRIPEMLEVLALLPDERIDRRRAEELFDLRRSAAHELLRRLGAERCGNALAIQPQHADSAVAGSAGTPRLALGTRAAAIDTESHRNTAARSPQIPSASYSRVTESNGHSCEHGTSRLNTVLARSVHCCMPGHGAFGGTTGARNWRTNPETQLTHALGYWETQRFEIRLKRGSHLRQNQARKSAPVFASLGLLHCGEFWRFSPKEHFSLSLKLGNNRTYALAYVPVPKLPECQFHNCLALPRSWCRLKHKKARKSFISAR